MAMYFCDITFCSLCSLFVMVRPGVKPNTVMYGRDLPESFFKYCEEDFPTTSVSHDDNVDLLLVVGTSLTVSPANSLVHMVRHI